jgi:hypothetical protein
VREIANEDTAFRNKETGNVYKVGASSRWLEEDATDKYGEIKRDERAVTKRMSDPHTVMITLTGSTRNDDGGLRAPADFLADLRESERAVKMALRRATDHDTEYLWMFGANESEPNAGYPHIHITAYVDGSCRPEDFRSVVDAHVRNSPVAESVEHPYDECISVRNHREKTRGGEDNGFNTEASTYMGSQLAALENDIPDADVNEQQFAAVMEATSTRQVRSSQGFGNMSDKNTDDSNGNWQAGRIVDGEFVPFEDTDSSNDGGGSDMVTIDGHPHSVDPVPWNEGRCVDSRTG